MSLQLARDSSASSTSETISNARNGSSFKSRLHHLFEQFVEKSSLLGEPIHRRLRELPSRRRDRLARAPRVIVFVLVRLRAGGICRMSFQSSKKIEIFARLNSNS